MKKYKITEGYQYLFFEEQGEYFTYVKYLLEQGYEFSDHVHLAVELKKDNDYKLLSFNEIPDIDCDIKNTFKKLEKNYKLVRPNYDKCILNTISSIRKYFNGSYDYLLDYDLENILSEKKYKNIIVMLLDGMGENILEYHLSENSFLKRNHLYTNTAIYPSTTAASTTATKNGLSPIRTAWLGWENYFKEVDKNLILFTGVDYKTDEPSGFIPFNAIPYKFFYDDLKVNGNIIEPDFTNPEYEFKESLTRSLKLFKNGENNVQYIYYTEPDALMHINGAYDISVTAKLEEIDKELEDYTSKLPEDTLLIISADHGHTNTKVIDLYKCDLILNMLKRSPSNDSRCTTFCVKDEYKDIFKDTFNALFGYAFLIYDSKELIEKEYFGKKEDKPSPRVADFLGDFVAVGINEYYFNYKGENNHLFKSHHAGITADEMLVPVVIYRK